MGSVIAFPMHHISARSSTSDVNSGFMNSYTPCTAWRDHWVGITVDFSGIRHKPAMSSDTTASSWTTRAALVKISVSPSWWNTEMQMLRGMWETWPELTSMNLRWLVWWQRHPVREGRNKHKDVHFTVHHQPFSMTLSISVTYARPDCAKSKSKSRSSDHIGKRLDRSKFKLHWFNIVARLECRIKSLMEGEVEFV